MDAQEKRDRLGEIPGFWGRLIQIFRAIEEPNPRARFDGLDRHCRVSK